MGITHEVSIEEVLGIEVPSLKEGEEDFLHEMTIIMKTEDSEIRDTN